MLYHLQQVGTGGLFVPLRPHRPDQLGRLDHPVQVEFEYRQLPGDLDGMQRQYPVLVLVAVDVSFDGRRGIVEGEFYVPLVIVLHLQLNI